VLDGLVHVRGGGVRPLALRQLQQVYQPIGHHWMVLADRPGDVLLGRAVEQSKQAAHRTGNERRADAQQNGAGKKKQAGSEAGLKPQRRLQRGGEKPEGGRRAPGKGAPKGELRPRHASRRPAKTGAEALDESGRLFAHGREKLIGKRMSGGTRKVVLRALPLREGDKGSPPWARRSSGGAIHLIVPCQRTSP